MTSDDLTAPKAAYRLTRILNTVADAQGVPRFPIDVKALALEAARIFNFDDPISRVEAANIERFEGALIPDDARSKWMLLYNNDLSSSGRIRFTQAHELGHYLIHRMRAESFRCSQDDLLGGPEGGRAIESEADCFAATLLMPLDDFRAQTMAAPDFEFLGHCADRYGVSLTAATLRWLEYTDHSAVLVVHRDGFMRWAKSSEAAFKNGAFFKTRQSVIEVPAACVGLDPIVQHDRKGRTVRASIWFPNAHVDAELVEMKIMADQYDWTMSLLLLPRGLSVWVDRGDNP